MPAEKFKDLLTEIEACYQDPDIRNRSFYPELRRAWDNVFARASVREEDYFDFGHPRCFVLGGECAGNSFEFHVDQLKIYEWYQKEIKNRKKIVFSGKKLKRNRKSGDLMYYEAVCHYDPQAEESTLDESMRNVVACAVPCVEPQLQVVYGNKWIEKRFNPLRRNSVDIFVIGADYVPAFLGNAMEAALYLFLMDYCIIKTNTGKVKDEEIQNLLHITRKSPMLRIKGLV